MKTKRFVSTLLALLLICGLPVSAFADTWYVEDGNITVNATESGQTVTQGTNVDVPDSAPVITQRDSSTPTTNTVTINADAGATANVTIQDVNIVISASSEDTTQYKGQAAVTIDVADGASANVTLDGVRIDTENTGGVWIFDTAEPYQTSGYAAVQITGNGDVTLELDGDNTVQSGFKRAGVEKNTTDNSGNGNLTITDENGTDGSLEATGGIYGAGIGGGREGDGSNITITGSAEVTATGGDDGGAGIGGGWRGSGSDITITGSAEVTAKGGKAGSGIGGGLRGSGSENITVSGDAQVKAQGGEKFVQSGAFYFGAGAAIGEGGKYMIKSEADPGDDVAPNTNALNEGWVATYAPGTTNLDTAIPSSLTYKDASGTVQTEEDPQNIQLVGEQPATCTEDGHQAGFSVDGALVAVTIPSIGHSFTNYITNNDGSKTAKCDHCGSTDTIPGPSQPAAEAAPPYRVVDQDGKSLSCETERQDGVLTITVEADFASLTGKLGGIQTLKAQGIDTIVFVTNGATSTFALSDLLSQGSTGDSYTLTHDGSTVTFTLNNVTDVSAILQ